MAGCIIIIALMVVILVVYIGLYSKVADMARKRKRNAGFWVFASLIKNPLKIMLILKILGHSHDDEDDGEY